MEVKKVGIALYERIHVACAKGDAHFIACVPATTGATEHNNNKGDLHSTACVLVQFYFFVARQPRACVH
jgi:hypothetical protein